MDPPKSQAPYAWAERIDLDTVRVSAYLPEHLKTAPITIDGKSHVFALDDYGLHQTIHRTVSEQIELKVGKLFREEIAVFDYVKFEEHRSYDDDSLFTFSGDAMDSVNENRLRNEITRRGIGVSQKSVVIIEPPVLEQFYYNVREQMNIIRRRKVPTVSLLNELRHELFEKSEEMFGGARYTLRKRCDGYTISKNGRLLTTIHVIDENIVFPNSLESEEVLRVKKLYDGRGQHGATGLYLSSHLYRMFVEKGWNEFADLASRKIKMICQHEHVVDYNAYVTFLRRWSSHG
jgi:hypothetical protein